MDVINVIPDVDYARKKYEEIMELVNGKKLAPHYPNSLNGHLVGRMGEDAAYQFFLKKGLDPYPNYLKGNTGCDIFLRKSFMRVEVKAWRFDQYAWGGRAISEKQMKLVRSKADRIVWCSVDLAIKQVYLMGWSEVKDFDNAPLVVKGKLNLRSYQLEAAREIETF